MRLRNAQMLVFKRLQVALFFRDLGRWSEKRADDDTHGARIPGMVLLNRASGEKYIVTDLGNTMPIFASLSERTQSESITQI